MFVCPIAANDPSAIEAMETNTTICCHCEVMPGNAITAARNQVEKVYVAKANGTLTEQQERQFREGIPLEGRKTAPAGLKRIKEGDNPWYEVRLIEGRTNQIRNMFKHFGLLVEKLRRVRIAFLKLDVAPGEFRHLTPEEVAKFRRLLKMEDHSQRET